MNNIHTKGQFLDFCKEVFGDYQQTNNGLNIQVLCPICNEIKKNQGRIYNKRKLAIETNTHVLHCWVCGFKSRNLLYILKKYKPNFVDDYKIKFKNSVLLNNDSSFEEPQIIKLPDGFKLLVLNKKDEYSNKFLNYLKARGVSKEEDLWYWRFGYSKDFRGLLNRIIVPSFDNYGKLNYFTARIIENNIDPKYINPYVDREKIIFNELNIQWDKELTLVEGVFDLIKCNENATCVLGSDLTSNYELFQKIILNKTPIVLGLDPDAHKKTIKIAERLYEFCVPVRIIQYDSMNDIGSRTKNEFKDLLENAIIYDTEYYLRYKLSLIK